MVFKPLHPITCDRVKGRDPFTLPHPDPVKPPVLLFLFHSALHLYSFFDIVFRIFFIVSKKNTIIKKGGGCVEKFSPKKSEKEVISMRISTDTLAEIDRKAAQIDISRNEFINQCISFALSHMEDAPDE